MIDHNILKEALLIRRVEETFLELFSKGKLNGTVHTCVGQEFSAVAFAGKLNQDDFIFSNHRCHGHYLSFTKDTYGLIAELMGKKVGTCGGVGSSQHLCNKNFFSNGIQGGIIPVAAGYALANKIKKNNNIGIVFIGDGTLGEGVLYETMNIISKWNIPLMIVCENNFYAQSTPQSVNLSGDISKRPEAFDIKTFKSNTWDIEELLKNASESIDFVRTNGKPVFHLVDTYRLNAHSKGDDDREKSEIESFRVKDILNQFAQVERQLYDEYASHIDSMINEIVTEVENKSELKIDEYHQEEITSTSDIWEEITIENRRQVELLNEFFNLKMLLDEKTIFIGEDILSPYGGTFKVSKNLSFKFPDRVFSTPISEAALTGISNGLALAGFKPYAEIMFGDFVTLAMDQIVNHASKFHHMYNGKINCPVVIRTPMGGKRGYGPTHSQTLDKFLVGIDNVKTIAINTLLNPAEIYESVHKELHPVIVIENKIDYGKKIGSHLVKNYSIKKNRELYPVVIATPMKSIPTLTIVTYGSCADWIIDNIENIFSETDYIPEVIVLSKICPLDYSQILKSVKKTKRLVFVEEGSRTNGVGSEAIASIIERTDFKIYVKRIGAMDVPIPAVKSLENIVLPGIDLLIKELKSF